VVASLLVAGCTTSNTSQTPATTATTTSITNETFFEKFLAAYKDTQYSNSSRQIKAWDLEMINNTSARLQNTFLVKSSNRTFAHNITFTVFPTIQNATNYLNSIDKTKYSLASTQYLDSPSGLAYQNITGHAPQIFKSYLLKDYSEDKQIHQIDNIAYVSTSKVMKLVF